MRSNKYYAVPKEGESLEHRSHKYLSKKKVNGKWRYYYYEPKREFAERRLADENRIDTDKGNGIWTHFVDKPALFPTSHGVTEYDMSKNQAKRKLSGSGSLGNDRVLSNQTQNRLKAQSNAKKLATSGSLQKAKQEQAGYKKAASGLYETVNKKNVGAANKYSKKAKEASNKVASIGSSINAAKRKASGSSSLANQKQSTKKKKTSKVSKALKKGQSIINKLLGR